VLLGCAYLVRGADGAPNTLTLKAGGFFGLLTAIMAWYNALAGILDDSNRYAGRPNPVSSNFGAFKSAAVADASLASSSSPSATCPGRTRAVSGERRWGKRCRGEDAMARGMVMGARDEGKRKNTRRLG
jgi:hypothetical protein